LRPKRGSHREERKPGCRGFPTAVGRGRPKWVELGDMDPDEEGSWGNETKGRGLGKHQAQ
jgi:hypothetical protein